MIQYPPFAVSGFTTWHQTFEEDLALYRRLGIGWIEVCERKLSTDPARARAQLAAISAAGLRVSSVQPRVHALYPDFMCPDLKDPADRLARFRQSIDLFSAAFPGQNLPLVTIAGAAPNGDYRHAHQTARQLYPALADYAADRGLRVMFEPLNPMLMNHDTFICTLEDALRLIKDVNRSNFGLMLDVWHVWREPEICERIGRLGKQLFGVHISDWPAGEPRQVADRLLPGDGIIPLGDLLAATARAGYSSSYCLEIFSADELSDSLWRQDPVDLIQCGRQGFEKAWRDSN